MPLYEYQCEQCGHRFEVIQKFSDAPLADCPKCTGPIRKLLSSPAIQFKGTGWYITDYARKGGNGSTPRDNGSKSDTQVKDEGSAKSESSAQKSAESTGGSKNDTGAGTGGASTPSSSSS
ncbi:MAG: FmdB family zinc ribbon protein [Vicinamibacteraceae bacterium]